jgi:hypothetical protein
MLLIKKLKKQQLKKPIQKNKFNIIIIHVCKRFLYIKICILYNINKWKLKDLLI